MAHEAWTAGQSALEAGDLDGARRWFDRAHRIATNDPLILLSLAATVLRMGDPGRAASLFARVAERLDLRDAWIGLAAAHRDAGAHEAAARALDRMLRSHVVPADAPIGPLAEAVAAASHAPGWCCLRPDRTVFVFATGKGRVMMTAEGTAIRAGARLPSDSREVTIVQGGRALLGSPLDPRRAFRLEGFVEAHDGGIFGWAWHPAAPETDPVILVKPAEKGVGLLTTLREAAPDAARPLARPRRIQLPSVPAGGIVHVTGADGRELVGSPLDPGAERRAAEAVARAVAGQPPGPEYAAAIRNVAIPADIVGEAAAAALQPGRAVAVVVPVHGGGQTTLDCLTALRATVPAGTTLIVVDDASPDPVLVGALDALARDGSVVLIRHARNCGFPAGANAGMRAALAHAERPDVVLLNSDTLTPPGWLEALRTLVHGQPDIGTATPFSNDATILSYPSRSEGNLAPAGAALSRLAVLAAKANAGVAVDIPTAIGFCMYIRRECLDRVGLFREDLFAQGYGEENDFCLRARHLGWRHVAAPGVYVAHAGAGSFGAARERLVARNLAVLERRHPGYHALIADFEARDPLAGARRRLDVLRWRAGRRRGGAAILITHDSGGGVERVVRDRCAALRAAGMRAVVLRPVPRRTAWDADQAHYEPGLCVIGDGADGGFPNLRYRVPEELPALAQLLAADKPSFLEIHHLLGHTHAVTDLARRLGVPTDIRIHDYASMCPRITLVHAERRYCGEPADTGVCDACVADGGSNLEEPIAARELRARSAADFAAARRVIAPSGDAALRIRRHFPQARLEVEPHEAERFVRPALPPAPGPTHVVVPGAIGTEKGFDVLLSCARDAAARDLSLRFTVVGHSADDQRLLGTGRVFVTGRYRDDEGVALLRAQRAHWAWLPSIWPETWAFTLGQSWQAGLPVMAFDLGAPAERIRRTGWGRLLPPGLTASAINNALLAVPPLAGDECAA